jgi:hypothetical protein
VVSSERSSAAAGASRERSPRFAGSGLAHHGAVDGLAQAEQPWVSRPTRNACGRRRRGEPCRSR